MVRDKKTGEKVALGLKFFEELPGVAPRPRGVFASAQAFASGCPKPLG